MCSSEQWGHTGWRREDLGEPPGLPIPCTPPHPPMLKWGRCESRRLNKYLAQGRMTAWRQGIHSDCSVLLCSLIHSNALHPYWLWIKGLRNQVLKEDTIASLVAVTTCSLRFVLTAHFFILRKMCACSLRKAQWFAIEMLPRYSDVIQHKAGPLYAIIPPGKLGGLPWVRDSPRCYNTSGH